jgi:hypothetical protein
VWRSREALLADRHSVVVVAAWHESALGVPSGGFGRPRSVLPEEGRA